MAEKKERRMSEYIVDVNDSSEMYAVEMGRYEELREVIRCKDCKYFELDHIEKVMSTTLIVAHEICTRWGNGCKTSPDGYCFMAKRKENETS